MFEYVAFLKKLLINSAPFVLPVGQVFKYYFPLIFINATPFAPWKNTMLIHIASCCKTTSLICLLEFYSWFKKFGKHYGRTRKVTSQAWQGS